MDCTSTTFFSFNVFAHITKLAIKETAPHNPDDVLKRRVALPCEYSNCGPEEQIWRIQKIADFHRETRPIDKGATLRWDDSANVPCGIH